MGWMIRNFSHRGLKRFYDGDSRHKLPADKVDRIGQILAALDVARQIKDLDIATLRLHPLKGERQGSWAVTVRADWRIVFRFADGDAFDVDLVDYH
jgi:proteic killer suppression protein